MTASELAYAQLQIRPPIKIGNLSPVIEFLKSFNSLPMLLYGYFLLNANSVLKTIGTLNFLFNSIANFKLLISSQNIISGVKSDTNVSIFFL